MYSLLRIKSKLRVHHRGVPLCSWSCDLAEQHLIMEQQQKQCRALDAPQLDDTQQGYLCYLNGLTLGGAYVPHDDLVG